MRNVVSVLSASLIVVASMSPARSQELTFVTAAGPPMSANAAGKPGFLDLLLKEAFGRLGRKIRLQPLPAERALLNANKGFEDGDAYRIGGLEKTYRNLRRVPEPVLNAEFVAYSRGQVESSGTWSVLKGRSVGIITGWKIFEKNLTNVALLTQVRDPDHLFGLLRRGRVDVVMFGKWQGLWYLKSKGWRFHMWPEPFAQRPMYVYLNKKHQDLVEPLADGLRAMKADGSFQRIFNSTLEKLEDQGR